MNEREEGTLGRDAWRLATRFDHLGELGARFVEGRLDHFPGWGAPTTDEETDAIAPLLAAACRAGFLTVASQRGAPDSPGSDGRIERRRAFVTGFVSSEAVPALEALREHELEVVLDRCDELPLGTRGDDVFLLLGPGARGAELELFEQDLASAGYAALEAARWVAVIDAEWGRDDLLWPALAAAFGTPYLDAPNARDEPT